MNGFVKTVPTAEIKKFCKRWMISKLALFGSILREDFGPESDVDVLVAFSPEADWSLLDHVRMQQELQDLFHRNVDLVTTRAIERSRNKILRGAIFNTAQTLFPPRERLHAAG
ncbi:MAG: nucleotidyltransferase family protein [Candidatus Edwardsbacteria bacterium]|nr:nucleotidyltransferase family protein [Candidatus Edwardsbacteria bacterium]